MQRPLGGVVVDLETAIVEVSGQRVPAGEGMAHGLSGDRPRGRSRSKSLGSPPPKASRSSCEVLGTAGRSCPGGAWAPAAGASPGAYPTAVAVAVAVVQTVGRALVARRADGVRHRPPSGSAARPRHGAESRPHRPSARARPNAILSSVKGSSSVVRDGFASPPLSTGPRATFASDAPRQTRRGSIGAPPGAANGHHERGR